MKRKAVVTGMGVVSPIGIGLASFRRGLQGGLSGLAPITRFDTSRFPVKSACEVKDFNPSGRSTHLLDPFIRYAAAATEEALADARFEVSQMDPFRIGISVSSSKGGMHTLDRLRERFESNPSALLGARLYANAVPNFAAQWIARRWKIQGPAKCYVAACATGTVSVIEGARMIEEGEADYCLAGASDASIVPLMLAGYRQMKVLSPDGMRPFDRRRKGFVVGEGAGILFLESEESAQRRGAKIYGKILNWAHSSYTGGDALRANEEDPALSWALQRTLERSGLQAGDIHYINLHGTGTASGDLYETSEIKKAFGREAYRIPTSSTKSMTGHLLGASGAVEIIATLLAMQEGFIPPTVGLEKPDPQCDLDYTPGRSRAAKISCALSLSMGFGGHISTVALSRN